MKRLNLDTAPPAVKEFLRSHTVDDEAIELELAGQVIGTLLPPLAYSDAEKAAAIERGRDLVRQARQRNAGVPAKVIEREVRQAVDEVRRQQGR